MTMKYQIATRRGMKPVPLVLALALILAPISSTQASAFSGSGGGTEEDPYLVSDCQELQEINDEKQAYYQLVTNIDCSDTINWNEGEGFVPIGDSMVPFTGELDGQDFAVNGIYIHREFSERQGIFGMVGSGDNQVGLIKNIYFGDIDITGTAFTGGVVGQLYGQLNRVHAEGQVQGTTEVGGLVGTHGGTFDTVINSRADVDVTGDALGIGGLVGYNDNDSEIINSYATGSVTGVGEDSQRVGGLVGHNLGTIESSHATGNVVADGYRVGGLAGRNGGLILRSYATGSILAQSDAVGGLVGYNSAGHIVQSYSDNTNNSESNFGVIGSCDVGGLVGANSSALIQDSFSRSNVTTTMACNVGGLFGVSGALSTTSYTYATGEVSGALDSVGGFGGAVDNGDEIAHSFFDTETTQQDESCNSFSAYDCGDSGRAISKTTAQMHDIDTFTTDLAENSWDFETTWDIDAGINDNYPYFQIVGAEEFDLSEGATGSAGTLIIEPDGDANKAILIQQLEDTEICSEMDDGVFTRTEPQLEVQDQIYNYTSHLVGFTMNNCEVGGTTTMRLLFTGTFDPETTVVRKYDSQTQQFTTIENAVMTVDTFNDLPALDVRYEITDGGELDQDGEANGTIVDPVGLASLASAQTSAAELAASGSSNSFVAFLSVLLLAGLAMCFRNANNCNVERN
jgi:hypothetical protein